MGRDKRRSPRVLLKSTKKLMAVGIDRSWSRDCTMIDVSDIGILLSWGHTIERHDLEEFFLILPESGLVYRRCQLVRLEADKIAARFVGMWW